MSTTAKSNLVPEVYAGQREPSRASKPLPKFRSRRNPAAPSAPSYKRLPAVDFSLLLFCYIALTLFMGLAAANSQANLLFAIFGIMVGVLLITYFICRMVLSRLRVVRILPEHATVGQPATIQYQFHNNKRWWPSLSVLLSELNGAEAFARQPCAYMFHAAPKMTAVVPIDTLPKRRGLHQLDTFQMSSSFPFGFLTMAATRRQHDSMLIFPAVGEVSPKLLTMCRSADRSGTNQKPRPDGSDEFYGVKEYREGENPRWIYWKRSARTGQLVSKQMALIAPPNLLIVVDTYLPRRTLENHIRVEKGIAMAASLASQALDSGMAVGVCAWAKQWISIAPQKGKRHCRDILASLAGLPLNQTADVSQVMGQAMKLMQTGVTPILFTQNNVQIGLLEQVRGASLVIPVESQQARAWFHFDAKVDFANCMPLDQQPDDQTLAAANSQASAS